MSKDEIVTSDLAEFGLNEMASAAKLLDALVSHNQTESLGKQVRLYFNKRSGKVFLGDEDCNSADVDENGNLQDWINCPYCSEEGLREKFMIEDNDNLVCPQCEREFE